MRPRLLDLFCGAGGAAMGYHRAGFDVVGVDIEPQPNYPFEFVQADALGELGFWMEYGRLPFDAIHASPPCQAHSRLKTLWRDRNYPDLIAPTRGLLIESGVPWVLENVDTAPLARQPDIFGAHGIELCGSMFGLEVRRHRLFESKLPLDQPACRHETQGPAVGVYGHTGAGANRGLERRLGRTNGVADWRRAMGIDWMNAAELADAIPPAYTEFIGEQLLQHIGKVAA